MAPGLSGNQCSAIALSTASNEPSSTSMAMTSSARRSNSTPGYSAHLPANFSSMPAAGSTPVTCATGKRASMAAVVKPVPQPTSSTRR